LLPISMMVMFGLACCLASSSQLAKWLNVSRLHNKITHRNIRWQAPQKHCQGDRAQFGVLQLVLQLVAWVRCAWQVCSHAAGHAADVPWTAPTLCCCA
jgi:hypothetical protein